MIRNKVNWNDIAFLIFLLLLSLIVAFAGCSKAKECVEIRYENELAIREGEIVEEN